MSEKVLSKAIKQFYSQNRLYPAGVVSELPAVQDWALKQAKALKRLVPRTLKGHVRMNMFVWFIFMHFPPKTGN